MGLSLWLLREDGKRHHLHQQFPIKFYIAGPSPQLRAAWRWLSCQPEKPVLAREERRDLFSGLIPVLSVELSRPLDLPRLFGHVSREFPDLTYYDADIHLSLHHAARYGTYSLADCELEVDARSLGAVHAVDASQQPDVAQAIHDLTGGGAQVSLDALGSRVTCRNSVACLRKRGRHVQVGLMLAGDPDTALPMDLVIAKELEIYGSHGMPAHAYPAVFEMIRGGRLRPELLVHKTVALAEAATELTAMSRFNTLGATVIDRF